jgi:hypothetical protein
MARHPIGASADFCDPTEIRPLDFDRRIVGAVLDALGKYHVQKFDTRIAKKFSDDGYAEFVRGHDCVNVTLYEDNRVVTVVPCFPREGGAASRKGYTISFGEDEIGEKLPEALRASFSALERG